MSKRNFNSKLHKNENNGKKENLSTDSGQRKIAVTFENNGS